MAGNGLEDSDLPLIMMTPFVTYSVRTLKNMLRALPSSPTKTRMLQSPVVSCNYTITPYCCGVFRRVKNIYGIHIQSVLTLQEHFDLHRLLPHCQVGLCMHAQRRLQSLIIEC
jgi:hypothetical protein